MDKIPVIFRKWKEGDIIAILPTIPGTCDPYTCESYMHIGQHGAADAYLVMGATKPATPDEYADLLTELQQIGYDLDIKKRYQHKYYDVVKTELNRMNS